MSDISSESGDSAVVETPVSSTFSEPMTAKVQGRGRSRGRQRGRGRLRSRGRPRGRAGQTRADSGHSSESGVSAQVENPASSTFPQPSTSNVQGQGRGHGRPRGRGGHVRARRQSLATEPRQFRPRGRGGRKATRKSRLTEEDKERIKDLQHRKQEEVKTAINQMSEDDVRHLLQLCVERKPGMMFDIWDIVKNTSNQPGPSGPPNPETPPWCSCHNCRLMPTDIENLCCGQNQENCISLSAQFQHYVLDPPVVALHNIYRQEVMAIPADGTNKSLRYGCYRQYILWVHGKLGEGVRRVIPSCIVWKIRASYPEASGQYVGFTSARLL